MYISHDDFVEKHTLVQLLLLKNNEDKTVLIVLDGKYIFIPKRSDCTFLRQSYNIHRPLVKPMVVVHGALTNNDAAIIGRMVTMKFEGMNDWLQTKDLYIVDKGFRDVIVLIS